MTAAKPDKPKKSPKRNAARFCGVLGILLFLLVIAVYLPLTVPRLFGYEIYTVVSGSMEPAIPTGSIVYVQAAYPQDIAAGEIIAYRNATGEVVVHRVVENYVVEGVFSTKGDANTAPDPVEPAYNTLVGRAVLHLPVLGRFAAPIATTVGKVYMLGFVLAAVMLRMLSDRLRAVAAEEEEA